MDTDIDTFLVAVSTQIDTLPQTELILPPHPGPPPRMADSEVLTLLGVGHWHGASERALLRWANAELRSSFPVQLSQSAFNRRVRRLGPICARLISLLADILDTNPAPYKVVDTIGVSLARQCRGRDHRLFGDATGLGRTGSDRQFLYGCSLLLSVTPAGMITGLMIGPAGTQDRWLLDALLCWRRDPTQPLWTVADLADHSHRKRARSLRRTGPTGPLWWPDSVGHAHATFYLTDNGFAGPVWRRHWREDAGAEVIASRNASTDPLAHHRRRQIVETVNAALVVVLHLAYPKAKTMWGVVRRIAGKCLALNLGIWVNRVLGRPGLSLATLVSC